MNFFEYAEQNRFALFPLLTNTKRPAIGFEWKSNNSPDPDQWRRWQSEHGENFGIVAASSALIIVDLDTTKEGGRDGVWKRWVAWCESKGLPVYVPQTESARKGLHCYFKCPADVDPLSLTGSDIASGINVKAGWGYAVAPGSYYDGSNASPPEESGRYSLYPNAAPPYDAPAALVNHCTPRTSERTNNVAGRGQSNFDDVLALYKWCRAYSDQNPDEEDSLDRYKIWIELFAFAAGYEFGDEGRDLADAASSDPSEITDAKWASCVRQTHPRPVTLGSVRQWATERGWSGTIRPVQKTAAEMFAGAVDTLPPGTSMPTVASPPLAPAVDLPKLIQSSAQFVKDFLPPDYLIDGILQRRFCYSITAQTGTGKTAICLLVAAHVGLGRNLDHREVAKGRALYFAGENPDDIRMRWLGMSQQLGFSVDAVDVHFIAGVYPLSEIAGRVRQEAEVGGLDLSLVVIDTSAAYFEGDDENSNTQAIAHARRMRSLVELPGGPTVLICAHPTKNSGEDNLVPRGGGAFLNEVDGNLICKKHDAAIEVHWAGKFRGPDFAPILFELHTVRDHPLLKDSRGRNIPTVVAQPLGDDGKQRIAAASRRSEDMLLSAIEKHPGASSNDLAKALGWLMGDGKPYGVRVRRAAATLVTEKLVQPHRGSWKLTPKGQLELNNLDAKTANINYALTPLVAPPLPPGTVQNNGVPAMPILPPIPVR